MHPKIPFKNSPLTKILKPCLGGPFCTSLVIHISLDNLTEAMSTLRFGTRAKKIKNMVERQPETDKAVS